MPILPPSSPEHHGYPPLPVSASSGHDVTTVSTSDEHVTGTDDELNAMTPTLRFRLADDSFYEWIAEGGGRRQMGKSPAARFWERWLKRNWTILPNATSDDYDALLAALDVDDSSSTVSGTETMSDVRQQDARVSWMYSTKTVVQLLSSPLVGFTVHRYVIPLRYVIITALRSITSVLLVHRLQQTAGLADI